MENLTIEQRIKQLREEQKEQIIINLFSFENFDKDKTIDDTMSLEDIYMSNAYNNFYSYDMTNCILKYEIQNKLSELKSLSCVNAEFLKEIENFEEILEGEIRVYA